MVRSNSGRRRYADGGEVDGPGTGRSDSIPADLSDGEFVVNAKSAKEHKQLLKMVNGGFVDGESLTDWLGGDYDARFDKLRHIEEAFSLSDMIPGGVADHDIFDEIEGMLGNVNYDEVFAMLQGGIYSPEKTARNTINKAMNDWSFGDAVESMNVDVTPEMFEGLEEYIHDLGTNDIMENFDDLRKVSVDSVNNYLVGIMDDMASEWDEASMDFGYAEGGLVGSDKSALDTINMSLGNFSISDALENMDIDVTKDMIPTLGEYINDLSAGDLIGDFDNLKGLTEDDVNWRLYELVNDLASEYDEASMSFGYKCGGLVHKYDDGGKVRGPGTGTSDSIPALLSNGEFVVNAKDTSKYRGILEQINAGKFANGGTVGDAESYQFLQFQNQGKTGSGGAGSFDFDKTMEKFVNHLEAANPKVQNVIEQLEFLRDKSSNLNEEQTLQHDYTRRINRALIELNEEKKDEAAVTKDAAGAVKDLGDNAADAAEELKNVWEGMGKELTGPIKKAFLEGGSIGDAIKQGMHGLLQGIAGKLMDRAFKPLEDMLDNALNDLFGSGEIELGSSAANPMITKNITGATASDFTNGKFLSGGDRDEAEIATGLQYNTDMLSEQTAMLAEQSFDFMDGTDNIVGSIFDQTDSMGGFFDNIGGLFSEGLSGLGSLFSSGGSSSGGGGFDLFGSIGSIFGFAKGGMVPKLGQRPQYFASGGFAKGTDTVPAMLTPGEMVLNKNQQDMMGSGGTTYNTYNLEVTGNVDQRSINQIRNIIQNSPNQVNQASQRGERERTGLRPSNRR